MKKFSQRKYKKSSAESWQTIYMDLMTIIMVFFVILWSLNKGQDIGVSETVGNQSARMINLPGDVLFAPGKTELTQEGGKVFDKLFGGNKGNVLNFATSSLVKRVLMIHGHTDSDGDKMTNFELGYKRALSAYEQLNKYNPEIPNHVVICTHADNSPEQEVPKFKGNLSRSQKAALKSAKKKNRRITIEDKIFNKFGEQ